MPVQDPCASLWARRGNARALLPLLLLAAVVLAGCTTPEAYKERFERDDTVLVRARGLDFAPMNLTIPVNTTVVWVNQDFPTRHTVTFEDNATVPLDEWLGSGEQVEWTFTEPGVYDYRCRPHSSDYRKWGQMVGRITVVDGSAS